MRTIEGDDDSYDVIDKGWRKVWCNDKGQWYRADGLPDVIYDDGSVFYFKNGNLHRDDGLPAMVLVGGIEEYWVNGVQQK